MTNRSPFRYFKTSPDIIRLAVMMYIRFPLSLRNVEGVAYCLRNYGSHQVLVRSVAAPASINQLLGVVKLWSSQDQFMVVII
jgi:transposase-like protein